MLVTECDPSNPTVPKPGATFHPLGPLVYRVVAQRPVRARLIAAAVFLGCATLLFMASRLEPDPAGLGSHEQFGLPPCSAIVLFGYPCPTCGMTTAFAYLVRGKLLSAFDAQPAGFVLALATVLAASLSLGTLFTGRVWAVNWFRVSPAWVVSVVVLLVLGGWGYKLVAGVMSGTLPMTR
jgi:hypothetical protein